VDWDVLASAGQVLETCPTLTAGVPEQVGTVAPRGPFAYLRPASHSAFGGSGRPAARSERRALPA